MTTYTPPLEALSYTLSHLGALEAFGLEPDMREAILSEAGKLAADVIAPTNRAGDTFGAKFDAATNSVTTAPGFKEAYAAMQAAGWCGAPFSAEHGGQELPWPMCFALQEIWASANMAFSLCPLLTQGSVEVISRYGTPTQKQLYLEKLASGVWSGTMQLTESQAGSDVGALRTKAVPAADGSYRLFGQKIFITYGEQDITPNIIHLVLARLPDAPAGSKGISLFIVPKFLVNADGSLGARNDVTAISLEHKLGIHGSPTAVMSLGDAGEGAIGYLIGQPHRGLDAMFTMMNAARLGVGIQGLAIAERAFQLAKTYADTRVQGKPLGHDAFGAPIAAHPDVERMLLTQEALITAMRSLVILAGTRLEEARRSQAPAAQAEVDLLTPVVKAWSTDMGERCASLGVQIHGGMGYIEETGAAQHYRDARISSIYEGTNGIQAQDLLFRKLARDDGAAAAALFDRLESRLATEPPYAEGEAVRAALKALRETTAHLLSVANSNPRTAAFVASDYLALFGLVVGGAFVVTLASSPEADVQRKKVASFYVRHLLPTAHGLAVSVMNGA